jgi:large subunit ribosomal protein L6
MSRVGKYPVVLPEGVTASINGNVVHVKGKLGELNFAFDDAHVNVELNEGKLVVTPHSQSRTARTLWGTTRAQINSLVKGVSVGYSKSIELFGVGYKARMEGKNVVLSLGFSHDVPFATPNGITIACESPTVLKISGVDKQLVGQVAAEIRKYRKPEPYKGKGIRVDGEYVRRKEGKKK